MKPTPRKIALHIIIMVVVLVAISALAIWFDLGPVAHSTETTVAQGSH